MRCAIRIHAFRLMFIRGLLAAGCVAIHAPGALAAAAPGTSAPATVFYDAHVFTAEYEHPYAEALAISGDKIIAVGALRTVEQVAGPTARKVDLHGKFLMPGMIDAHAHPIAGGLTLIQARYPDTERFGPRSRAIRRRADGQEYEPPRRRAGHFRSRPRLLDACRRHRRGAECGQLRQATHRPIRLRRPYRLGQPARTHSRRDHTAVPPKPLAERAALLWLRCRIQSERLCGRCGQKQARPEPPAAVGRDHAGGRQGGGALHEFARHHGLARCRSERRRSAEPYRRAPKTPATFRCTRSSAGGAS